MTRHHLTDTCADGAELLARGHTIGRALGDAKHNLLFQAADANLEELVEITAEDGKKLRALQKRRGRVLGERQDAVVEVEPAELAIDQLAELVRHGDGLFEWLDGFEREGRGAVRPSVRRGPAGLSGSVSWLLDHGRSASRIGPAIEKTTVILVHHPGRITRSRRPYALASRFRIDTVRGFPIG